jgi:outer membrane murein-binding lipoprotein Lpp
MKTNALIKIVAVFAIIILSSCSKDNNDALATFTTTDIATNAKIDQISNDVADIIEDQYAEQNPLGKPDANVENTTLPSCVTVTTTLTSATWTRIINFGTTGCAVMPNGAILRGVITISGSLNYTLQNYVISYTFVNFYHNDVLIQGNRTITRSFQSTNYQSAIHPVNVMDMNMTFTTRGDVYTRVGTRTRECVEGFDTRANWSDNIYVVTGSWATTFPNGIVHSNVISATTPLRIRMNCNYRIVSGMITITRPNHTATLDYGTGTCDNIATMSIDGGVAIPFTFGN